MMRYRGRRAQGTLERLLTTPVGRGDIMLGGQNLGDVVGELAVLAGFAVVLLALAAATVRRS